MKKDAVMRGLTPTPGKREGSRKDIQRKRELVGPLRRT
jgi:hypothetical protein